VRDPLRNALRARWTTVLIAIGAVVAIVLVLILMTPRWWSERRNATSRGDANAHALESGLVEIATRVGDRASVGDASDFETTAASAQRDWAIRIDEAQINAWLATRLPAWLEHRGVDAPPVVRVRLRADRTDLAIRNDAGGRVYTITVEAGVRDGALSIRPTAAWIGLLPIPVAAVPDSLFELPGRFELAAEGGTGAWEIEALDLGDGRRVEFVDIEIRPGELRLRARTVR